MMGVMAARAGVEQDAPAHPSDFAAWMAAEQRRVYLLCYRMLADRDEADTATQESFLKAYQALSRPGAVEVEEPAKWLTRIAVNTCLDRLRSRRWQFWRRRLRPEDEDAILALAPDSRPNAEDEMLARQIRQRLAEALGKLSPRQRSVFVLRHYEDQSLEEIAVVLQLEVGTVKAHMARALAKLRGELRDLYFRQSPPDSAGG